MKKALIATCLLPLVFVGISLLVGREARVDPQLSPIGPEETSSGAGQSITVRGEELAPAGEAIGRTEEDSVPSLAQWGDLLVQVLWSDGTPAASVRFEVVPQESRRLRRYAVTNSQGTFLVEGLPGGEVTLTSYLAGVSQVPIVQESKDTEALQPRVTVLAGSCTRVTVTLPQGAQIRGRVLDQGGRVVPGASLWGTVGRGSLMEPVGCLGTADASGNYYLRSVSPGYAVFASASALGCSQLVSIAELSREKLEGVVPVDLVLYPSVGDLEVIARLPDGRPAIAARVRVRSVLPENGKVHLREFLALTDEDGRALFNGVPATRLLLFADMPSLPLWHGNLSLPPGGREFLEVFFVDGFAVEGRVTGALGSPMPGARIKEYRTSYLPAPGPPFSDYFEPSEVETSPDGSFRLFPLFPGAVELRAFAPSSQDANASTIVTGVTGETVRWDPVMDAELAFHGRLVVVGEGDLSNWELEAVPVRHKTYHEPKRGHSDALGAFEIKGVLPGLYDLRAFAPGASVGAAPQGELRRLRPSDSPLEFLITAESRPSGQVVGRVLGPGGMPVEDVRVELLREHLVSPHISRQTDESGRFNLGQVRPGSLRLQYSHPEFGIALSELVDVAPGARLDIGDQWLCTPGQLEILVHRVDGEQIEGLLLGWQSEDTAANGYILPSNLGEAMPFAPGKWLFWTYSLNASTVQREVTIRSNELTQLDLPLGPALRCALRFLPPEKLDPRPYLQVQLSGGALEGELTLPARYSDNRRDAPAYELFLGLSPGTYRYELLRDSGRGTAGSFRVVSNESQHVAIDIELAW